MKPLPKTIEGSFSCLAATRNKHEKVPLRPSYNDWSYMQQKSPLRRKLGQFKESLDEMVNGESIHIASSVRASRREGIMLFGDSVRNDADNDRHMEYMNRHKLYLNDVAEAADLYMMTFLQQREPQAVSR